jgi:hypothetical protein
LKCLIHSLLQLPMHRFMLHELEVLHWVHMDELKELVCESMVSQEY